LKLRSLRPNSRDIGFALGDLEAAVLRRLWQVDKPVSVRDFQGMISRTHPIAVTTVATILDRLYQKGLVSRQLTRIGGPHYMYKARMTENEFKHAVVNNVMGTLLQSFNDVTVTYLAEKMSSDSPNDRRILSKYLSRLKNRPCK
jgi:predicted transcriptional regulator